MALAGYPDWMQDDDANETGGKYFDLASPLVVYADDGTKKDDFDKYVSNVEEWIDWKGENHNYLDQRVFLEDLDGDGRADMLEKVFEIED